MEDPTRIDPESETGRWRRIKEILTGASALSLEERRSYITDACAADDDLKNEVERLLKSLDEGDSFLETPAIANAPSVFEEKATRIDDNTDRIVTNSDGFVAGTILANRYRILGLLGKGGMGEVYKADDIKLGQVVALKFLPDRLERNASALERFHAEVRTARQVSHPNVCRVFDIGEIDGRHFLSMEFIDGDDLSSLLRRVGRLSAERAVEIARELCVGLAAIHNAGILHRDFKPANVIIDGKGKARITDFGIAGIEAEIANDRLRVGTPAYMSPEQIAGKDVSAKSDIYALGLVLYEIFTGKQAFVADSIPELIRKHQTETPTNPSEYVKGIDPLVESVIAQCIAKDPKDRPATALHVAMALPGGNPMQIALDAGETPSPEMVAASPKRGAVSPLIAGALLAGGILMLVFAAIASMRTSAQNLIPFSKPPEVMSERVNEIVTRFGFSDVPAERFSRFRVDFSYSDYIRENASKEDWEKISTGQPLVFVFNEEQSPRYFDVYAVGNGMWTNGPLAAPGMRSVTLDTRGRLIAFSAVPPKFTPESVDSIVDFSEAFRFAELDFSKFKEVEPRWTPPSGYDTRKAWEGVMPDHPEIALRVEAAGFQGKVVFFRLVYPWTKTSVAQIDAYTTRVWIAMSLFAVLVVLTVAAAAFLVRKNLKSGSGDRSGAFKTSFVVFCSIFLGWFLSMGHVPALMPELGRFAHSIRVALFAAAATWLLYLALEPFVRRNLPELIISWNRLLAGDWRDPLVGRDVLIGTVWAIVHVALIHAANLSAAASGSDYEPMINDSSLISLLSSSSMIFSGIGLGVAGGFLVICFFVLIFLILRRFNYAALAFFLIVTSVDVAVYGRSLPAVPFLVVIGLLGCLVNFRFGLLATVVSQVIMFWLVNSPLTVHVGAWFAGDMVAKSVLVAILLAYGYKTSMANNALFGRDPVRI
ncbi:MAG: serine/threonine protein kinase [Acidobacteria bacterium]|nr:serine/threonine protein kinase [Acidobacteriota bacterium]